MKAIDRPFTNIINGAMQFVIPVFQRDYSWTEDQCEQLWKDVIAIAERTSEGRHFLGSVVYIATEDSSAGFTRWLLIDGQQRVTTLTLLLTALRDHIKTTNWSGDDDAPTAKRINAYFLKNSEEEGHREHKLVLRRHDQTTLKSLLDRDEMPIECSERIRENYEFFREQLESTDPALVYQGIGRLVVVDVTLDRATDDPQLIFESLNSTGIDLAQSDLIRNFILMRLPEKEQTRLYDSYWNKIENLFRGSDKAFDAFIRDYMALKTEASKQEKSKEIYRGFQRIIPSLLETAGDLEELLGEMLRLARYYAAFSVASEVSPEVHDALSRLRKLVDVPAMLVTRLYDYYDRAKTLSTEEFRETLKIIESYILRRAVCGGQTGNYWQVFANIAYQINQEKPLESLQVGLARQRDSMRFPSDEEFRRELQRRDLYGLRVCSHILERLENYDNNEPTDTSSYSIEHVLPQNEKLPQAWRTMLGPEWKAIQERWIHRLGNLTLTGYNSTYSDRPFLEKKTIKGGFEESSVRLNKMIREQSQWTEYEIEQRGTTLSALCLKIWPSLTVESSAIKQAEQRELREQAEKRNVDSVPMSTKIRALYEIFREQVHQLDSEMIELAEKKTITYHCPSFFMEVLPRKHRLLLILPLEFNEVENPSEIVVDSAERKFYVYAKYNGGVAVKIRNEDEIEMALPVIRQSLELSKN